MKIITGMKTVDKNSIINNSGKMNLMKILSEEKRSGGATQGAKASGGVFR
ncbi:hypothetical protein [Methanosarcina siciliae]|nr:hypothetical protein [Methanosarcina siciliae]